MTTTFPYQEPPTVLKLLAHEVRWLLLRELVHSDLRVQELVERVNRPMNLVSYHLKQLRSHDLVTERRSSADGRDVYYRVDLPRLTQLYQESGSQLHPALANPVASQPDLALETTNPPLRILFLCTHNSARSQMVCFQAAQVFNSRLRIGGCSGHWRMLYRKFSCKRISSPRNSEGRGGNGSDALIPATAARSSGSAPEVSEITSLGILPVRLIENKIATFPRRPRRALSGNTARQFRRTAESTSVK